MLLRLLRGAGGTPSPDPEAANPDAAERHSSPFKPASNQDCTMSQKEIEARGLSCSSCGLDQASTAERAAHAHSRREQTNASIYVIILLHSSAFVRTISSPWRCVGSARCSAAAFAAAALAACASS